MWPKVMGQGGSTIRMVSFVYYKKKITYNAKKFYSLFQLNLASFYPKWAICYLYLKYNKNGEPKWTCHAFLGKWLNRSGKFWYQIESMDFLPVIYGLDFAYSPRDSCPSKKSCQKLLQKSDAICCRKNGAKLRAPFLPPVLISISISPHHSLIL